MTPVVLMMFPVSALALGGIGLGGGLYETLLVDRVWPTNLAIIQPSRGGLDRKLFWGPVHGLFELALLVSTWAVWSHEAARPFMIAALVTHFAARIWSFAYFIPSALRFEKAGALDEAQSRSAQRWVRLSRVRPVLEAVALVALAAVLASLTARA
jgi:hypothetical protein